MKEGSLPLDIDNAALPRDQPRVPCSGLPTTLPAILVRGAVKSYKQRILGLGGNVTHVLRGLNMTVPSGSIYGLLGASGCGKTTLLKSVIGQTYLDAGAVLVRGRSPRSPGSGVPGRGVGYMPQELALYGGFTVAETLRYFGWLTDLPVDERETRASALLRLLQLPDAKRFVGTLSGGQQRRVSFAVALLHRPPLLILDEPTVGVDPVLRQNIWEYLVNLTSDGQTTVLITTHYIEEARQAHCVGLMRQGVLLAEAPPDILLVRLGCESLEDAFLKLCVQQQQSTQSHSEDNNPHDDNHNLHAVAARGMWHDPGDPCLDASIATEEAAFASTQLPPPYKESTRSHLPCLLWKQVMWLQRNLVMLAFLMALPVVQCYLFGMTVGRDPKGLHLAISNEETDCRFGDAPGVLGSAYPHKIDCSAPSDLSCRLLWLLSGKSFVQDSYAGVEEARTAVERGHAWGAMHFGSNFTKGLIRRIHDAGDATPDVIDMSTADVWMDMSNQYIGQMMKVDLTLAMLEMVQSVMADCDWNPRSAGIPVRMETPIYGSKTPAFLDFVAPGCAITLIFFMAVASAVGSLISEKNEGLLERSLVTGVSLQTVLWSHISVNLVILAVQAVLVLVILLVGFQITNHGPLGWIVVLCFLQGACGLCLGMLVSSVCKTDMEATLLSLGSFFPFIFLSGMLWPVEGMHWVLRKMGWALPLTLPTTSLRYMMSRGWSIERPEVYYGFISTVIWIGIFLGATLFVIKSSKR